MQLAEVFSGDIDFYHDLRRGIVFRVYEMRDVDGAPPVQANWSSRSSSTRCPLSRPSSGAVSPPVKVIHAGRKESAQGLLRSPVESANTSGFAGAISSVSANLARARRDFAAPTVPVGAGDRQVIVAGRQMQLRNAANRSWRRQPTARDLSRFAAGRSPAAAQGTFTARRSADGRPGPHLHYIPRRQ
jgi:hypothetical protein